MRTFLFFLISLALGLALFAWAISFIGWPAVREAFTIFWGWQGMVVLGLTAFALAVGNWRWKEILKEKDVRISFWELSKSYLAGFSVMFLAPVILFGGEVFRTYALKKKNGIAWRKGISSVFVDRILEFTTNLLVIISAIIIFFLVNGFPSPKLATIFLGVPIFFGGIIFVFYFKAFKKESLLRFLFKLLGLRPDNSPNGILNVESEVFDFFKKNKKPVLKVFGLSFLRSGLIYLRAVFLISFLGVKLSWLPALSIIGFNYLALMIPIPAALGSHELIQASVFRYFGSGGAPAAAFAMMVRGAELILALLGILFLFKLGAGIFKGLLFRKLGLTDNNGHQ